MLTIYPSFAAKLEPVIFWASPETGINERIGDNVQVESLPGQQGFHTAVFLQQ
jgi:hypothetical protein